MYGELLQKTHTRTSCALQKRAVGVIRGVKPRTRLDPLFTELNLLRFQDSNICLIGKLNFEAYNVELTIFQSWFQKKNTFYDCNARQNDQYHIPSFQTRPG